MPGRDTPARPSYAGIIVTPGRDNLARAATGRDLARVGLEPGPTGRKFKIAEPGRDNLARVGPERGARPGREFKSVANFAHKTSHIYQPWVGGR